MAEISPLQGRRADQREALIACAERAIVAGGLGALKARDLARCVGCSLGTIYNLVSDLDEIVLRVGQRTMADLDAYLDAAAGARDGDLETQLIAWARAYCAFAASNRHRWRALFDFRMTSGAELPHWFAMDQLKLFARLERRLAATMPGACDADVERRARTLFSAVHGIVLMGLEQKFGALPATALDAELAAFVRIYVAGADGAALTTSP